MIVPNMTNLFKDLNPSNLPSIANSSEDSTLNTQPYVSCQSAFTSSIEARVSLFEIYEFMRSGNAAFLGYDKQLHRVSPQNDIGQLRNLVRAKKNTDAAKLKSNCWSSTVAAEYSRKRSQESFLRYNSRIPVDIDGIGHTEAIRLREQLKSDSSVEFAGVSPSGNGLKAIIKLQPFSGDFKGAKSFHRQAFDYIIERMQELYAVKMDPSGGDLPRLMVWTYDPEAYINLNAEALQVPFKENLIEPIESQVPAKANENATFGNTETVSTPDGLEALRRACDQIENAPLGERHHTRLRMSRLIGGITASGRLEESEALVELQEAALKGTATPEDPRILKTIHDGFDHGLKDPVDPMKTGIDLLSDEDDQEHDDQKEEAPPKEVLIPKGILPNIVEQYLEQVARTHATDYGSVFSAMLGCISIAMGGNKRIRVDASWEDKGLLWIALLGPSGSGKTHIIRAAGGELLEKRQIHLHDEFKSRSILHASAEKEHKQKRKDKGNQDKPPEFSVDDEFSSKPVRKRLYEQHLTLEKLVSLHVDNPTGLGILTDELSSVFDGMGQYKVGGNNSDKAKWLELFNGRSFSNPTFNDGERYIPSSFVPVLGGLQPDLLKKVINEESVVDGYASRFLFAHMKARSFLSAAELHRNSQKIPQQLEQIFDVIFEDRDEHREYRLSKAAEEILYKEQDRINGERESGVEAMYSVYSKEVTYLFRLALVIHVIRDIHATEVSAETADFAVQTLRFFESGARKAHRLVSMSDDDKLEMQLVEKVRALGSKATSARVINHMRRKFGGKGNYKKCSEFIAQLVSRKILRYEDTPQGKILCPS